MRISQHVWTRNAGWTQVWGDAAPDAQLAFYFSAPGVWRDAAPLEYLSALSPGARVVGCTTGGEIMGEDVLDDSVVATLVHFERTSLSFATTEIDGAEFSEQGGRILAESLLAQGHGAPRAVFVLADGMRTNGTRLIDGLRGVLPGDVVITGGLAGDGPDFRSTFVGGDCPPRQGLAVAVGLHGDAVHVGWGSFGGWERFGPERLISRADGNVLYELNGEPALALYKRYLGEEADKLPGSALLFPLTVRPLESPDAAVVRTIVGVDEATQSLTFAGDIPKGWVAQLMRGHFDGLVEGAHRAASAAAASDGNPCLALLISCIGRKLLMGQRIVDEVEAAAEALGVNARLTGFYSYGEIAPHGFTGQCELHNQTMTITTIGEG